MELESYLPIQEAAALYRVSDDTLYRLIRAGKLTRYKRQHDKRTWLKRDEVARELGHFEAEDISLSD